MPSKLLPTGDEWGVVVHGAATDLLDSLDADSVDAAYFDPPFDTGVVKVDPRDPTARYEDRLGLDPWVSMMREVAHGVERVLRLTGSCYAHLDWRRVHEAKLLCMDEAFGADNLIGNLVWAYDWGARQKDRFSRKHDDILHYAKEAGRHTFDNARVDRVPYKAPELQISLRAKHGKTDGAARIAAGKTVTDVFDDINIVGTNSKERSENSYPTMKPARLVERLLRPVTLPGSLVVDPFVGCGTSAVAALNLGCRFVVGDVSQRAFDVTCARLERMGVNFRVEKL